MKPVPIAFHIGPLQVHTYGIGLAVTFWFAYRYFGRRLRAHGYPDGWLTRAFVWIVVAAVVGARAVSVIANWSQYSHDLPDVFAVWHGGLSSYGGLLLGVPVGFYCARRWCPQLRAVVAADLVATVLVVAWSLGRLLGPQLMYRGGGPRTNGWYGLYYAGQVGKRVPVPLIQAVECFVIFLVALELEKLVRRRGGPLGLVATAVVSLWGLSRFFDEYVWLSHLATGSSHSGNVAVEVASLAFVGVGAAVALLLLAKSRGARSTGESEDPWRAPETSPPAEAAAGDGGRAGSDVALAAGGREVGS